MEQVRRATARDAPAGDNTVIGSTVAKPVVHVLYDALLFGITVREDILKGLSATLQPKSPKLCKTV